MPINSKTQYCEKCGKVIAVSLKKCYMCDLFSKSEALQTSPITIEELIKEFLKSIESEWVPKDSEELFKYFINYINKKNYKVTISFKK